MNEWVNEWCRCHTSPHTTLEFQRWNRTSQEDKWDVSPFHITSWPVRKACSLLCCCGYRISSTCPSDDTVPDLPGKHTHTEGAGKVETPGSSWIFLDLRLPIPRIFAWEMQLSCRYCWRMGKCRFLRAQSVTETWSKGLCVSAREGRIWKNCKSEVLVVLCFARSLDLPTEQATLRRNYSLYQAYTNCTNNYSYYCAKYKAKHLF